MQNFIIVGTQRTGSSALGEGIGLHPDVTCGWEWTEGIPRSKKLLIGQQALNGDFSKLRAEDQEHMAKVYSPETKWLGYRRLFGASNKWIKHPRFSLKLWVDRFEEHMGWISNQADIHVIHLIRYDNVNWLKSKFMAKKSGSFVGKPYPEDMRINIPVNEAIARLKSKEWIDTRLSTLAATNPYKRIIYEDMLENDNDVVLNVLNFLGCKPLDVINKERKIKKQSKGKAANYIANYEELIKSLDEYNLVNSNIKR